MANRCYLYNIDFNPSDRKKTSEDSILSVSESSYEIPISYKILLSGNPISSDSAIWDYDYPIAILGEFKKGKEALLEFLDKLNATNLFEKDYIQTQRAKTKEFLEGNSFNLRYFIMEAAELYEMGNEPMEEQNRVILNEAHNIEDTIDQFILKIKQLNTEINQLQFKKDQTTTSFLFKKVKPALSDKERSILQKEIENKNIQKRALLGIEDWSTVLYYQFDS